MPVKLFPNWVVKLVREPNLHTKTWLHRPVEVFHVSPKMTKFEIKEYLIKMYNLPVSHVHTAIYNGKKRYNREHQMHYYEADYKKAYVYLMDAQGDNRPRYTPIEFQHTPEARAAWPSMPDYRMMPRGPLPKKEDRPDDFLPPKSRRHHATRLPLARLEHRPSRRCHSRRRHRLGATMLVASVRARSADGWRRSPE